VAKERKLNKRVAKKAKRSGEQGVTQPGTVTGKSGWGKTNLNTKKNGEEEKNQKTGKGKVEERRISGRISAKKRG